jgi:hypothetical protein
MVTFRITMLAANACQGKRSRDFCAIAYSAYCAASHAGAANGAAIRPPRVSPANGSVAISQ